MSANVTTLPRPCKPWEKADDCAWNVKTARIVLLPFQISFFFFSLFIAFKILNRNRFWVSRPVLCMVLVTVSMFFDILEQSFVLSEMTEANLENNRYLSDWYGTSTFDAIGDIFLMISLWFFASVWCDNIKVLKSKAGEEYPEEAWKLRFIQAAYTTCAVVTIPLAIAFALTSYSKGSYDPVAITYTAWGVVSGFILLTPTALLMYKLVNDLPPTVHGEPSFPQLKFMACVNVTEQLVWNILVLISVISLAVFVYGDDQSAGLIGTAAIASQICWFLIHFQILLFFAFIPPPMHENPIFDEHLLHDLLDIDESAKVEMKHIGKPAASASQVNLALTEA